MPRICLNARTPVPIFRSSTAKPATGRRPRAIFDARSDASGMATARHQLQGHRALAHAAEQAQARAELYAGCDRAPLGWENR